MADPRPNSYTTELEGIRAPLGVILYLIRRDNLDIYDIPIARITKEYLDYLEHMETQEIDLAGEFFVLAATLMRVKIQMLLRRDDDTSDDPREGLVRSLLEYKKMAEAARTMREMEHDRLEIFKHPVAEPVKQYREDPEIDLSLFQLMKAFHEVMLHFEADEVREIELEEYTIEEKVNSIVASLGAKEQIAFSDLFEGASSRLELIVTLMALLELIKHGQVSSRQEESFSEVWLYRGEQFGVPMAGTVDWERDFVSPALSPDTGVQPRAEVEPTEGNEHVE